MEKMKGTSQAKVSRLARISHVVLIHFMCSTAGCVLWNTGLVVNMMNCQRVLGEVQRAQEKDISAGEW